MKTQIKLPVVLEGCLDQLFADALTQYEQWCRSKGYTFQQPSDYVVEGSHLILSNINGELCRFEVDQIGDPQVNSATSYFEVRWSMQMVEMVDEVQA